MNSATFAFLNGWEILLVLGIILILFGAKKLPELARGLGQGIKEFKKSTREVQEELESAMDVDAAPAPRRRLPSETEPRTTDNFQSSVQESPSANPAPPSDPKV